MVPSGCDWASTECENAVAVRHGTHPRHVPCVDDNQPLRFWGYIFCDSQRLARWGLDVARASPKFLPPPLPSPSCSGIPPTSSCAPISCPAARDICRSSSRTRCMEAWIICTGGRGWTWGGRRLGYLCGFEVSVITVSKTVLYREFFSLTWVLFPFAVFIGGREG